MYRSTLSENVERINNETNFAGRRSVVGWFTGAII